jgi:nicotinamidase/pyrazinamidase
MKRALLISDLQNDFCAGGSLAVNGADSIIPLINALSPLFDKVIAIQDWHPANHVSFARTHHRQPHDVICVDGIEQVLWPVHCVPGTHGAAFHKDFNTNDVDLILRKGSDPRIDSYSAFLENDKMTETGLHYYLKGLHLDTVYLCGLATDYCVYFSAMDAKHFGFDTHVIIDAMKGIDVPAGSIAAAIDTMKRSDIHIVTHEHIR